jgi:hypothetical protein
MFSESMFSRVHSIPCFTHCQLLSQQKNKSVNKCWGFPGDEEEGWSKWQNINSKWVKSAWIHLLKFMCVRPLRQLLMTCFVEVRFMNNHREISPFDSTEAPHSRENQREINAHNIGEHNTLGKYLYDRSRNGQSMLLRTDVSYPFTY